jgi:hypothetical protein
MHNNTYFYVRNFNLLHDIQIIKCAQVVESGKAPDCRSGDRGFKSLPALGINNGAQRI